MVRVWALCEYERNISVQQMTQADPIERKYSFSESEKTTPTLSGAKSLIIQHEKTYK